MRTHIERFFTRQYEMGRDRLLRPQCVCNYMEEAAGVHADALGVGLEDLAKEGLAWVLAKMRLRLLRRPGAGEHVVVETWPVGMEKIQFRRDFILYDASRQILATAVTQWVIMGLSSRKIERVPAHVAALAPEDPPLAQPSGDIRIPALQTGRAGREGPLFPVRLADIDQNLHVNNGRYVDFALEAAYTAGKTSEPMQIDLLFRAEALRGDVVGCLTEEEEGAPDTLIHSLFRQTDGQELARARTVFPATVGQNPCFFQPLP